jgi:CheY-like chemotaxis protein
LIRNRPEAAFKLNYSAQGGLELDKVLIVDDSDFDRKMLRRAIASKHSNIEFTELTSGLQITDVITQNTPKVAIIDIRMPGMDGFEVLNAIRALPQMSDVPVVMISGSEQPQDREMASAHGANGYYVKPPSVSDYFSLGRSIYDQYLCCTTQGETSTPC